MKKLIVFDLDGTIVGWTESYRRIYSGSLNEVIEKERGKLGLKILQYCRENSDGKGELALFLLNIPFRKWAEELMNMPLNGIPSQPALVKTLRKLEMKNHLHWIAAKIRHQSTGKSWFFKRRFRLHSWMGGARDFPC